MFCEEQCRCVVCGQSTFIKDESRGECVCWEHASPELLQGEFSSLAAKWGDDAIFRLILFTAEARWYLVVARPWDAEGIEEN